MQACIEAPLLAALDGESEPTTSAQIRQTLTALLVTTASQKPGYWIRLLGSVALAAPAAAAAAAQGQAVGGIVQSWNENLLVIMLLLKVLGFYCGSVRVLCLLLL